MPSNLVSSPILIQLGRSTHAFYSDRRSQLISTSSRVVSSSYAGIPTRIDDEMRQTEEDQDGLLTPYGPPDTIGNDLDWDEGRRGVPIPRPSTANVKRVENYRTSFRAQAKVDERSPLLPSLSEEAPAPIALGRQSDTLPTKSASAGIGQSTFCQTVSRVVSCL